MTRATPAGSWAILRCANCKTLELAASLNEAGFEAWSPVEVLRTYVDDRKTPTGKRMLAHTSPLMPGYVFARSLHLADLFELARSPSLQFQVWDTEVRRMVTRGHPAFRFLRNFDGTIASAADSALTALRNIERKRKPRGKVKPVEIGAAVRLDDGGFAGLSGTVESISGKFASVTFPGLPVAVKIAMWMLHEQAEQRRVA